MSLNGLFQTGRRSLRAIEGAIQTAGHNIANAGTEGFSRQRISLRGDSAVFNGLHTRTPLNTFTGVGVSVQGYERLRDGLLDRAANDARSDLGAADEELRAGQAMEGLFASGTDGSLEASVTAFWDAWSDASNAPTDTSVRGVLLDRADALAGVFHRLDADLGQLSGETRTSLSAGVDAFNALTAQVADLNVRIETSRAAGAPDLAAEDDRDIAVQALSAFAPVRVVTENDGSYTLSVQGMALVQDSQATPLAFDAPPGAPTDTVRFGGTDIAFKPGTEGGGRLAGWLRTLNQHVPDAQASLDALASRIATDVNAAHTAGFGLDDVTGRSFFDPAGLDAASFGRSADVDDPSKVALAGSIGSPGDTSVALALADLRPDVEKQATAVVGEAGRRVQTASARSEASEALVGHFESLAEGISGVSLDEEMTNLIEYQQAYAASARVLTTAQSMFDTLLSI